MLFVRMAWIRVRPLAGGSIDDLSMRIARQ